MTTQDHRFIAEINQVTNGSSLLMQEIETTFTQSLNEELELKRLTFKEVESALERFRAYKRSIETLYEDDIDSYQKNK